MASICCALSVAAWISALWWPQHNPQDLVQCSERAETVASSIDERTSLINQCDKQFVGRSKMDAGYTYNDFLHNRHFDIAGPNPTPKELKHFDEESQFQGDLDVVTGSISPPELPVVIDPANVPIPRARNSAVGSKSPSCEPSFSCGWKKFSAGIENFLKSNAKVNHP
jgi:hypothetical protein